MHSPLSHCGHGFAQFRAEHGQEQRTAWLFTLMLIGGLLGVQPNWESDVLAGVLLLTAAAMTAMRFALTASGMTALTNAYGGTVVGDAVLHLVELTRHWRLTMQLQPAWQ